MPVKANSCAIFVFLCVLSGCTRFEYDVLVEPAGKNVYRQITVGRKGLITADIESEDGQSVELQWEPSKQEEKEIDRIARIYDAPVPAPQRHEDGPQRGLRKSVTFGKKFRGKTPGDIGGAGFYARIKTNLGSCHLYMERIRGCNDQARKLQEAFGQADKTVNRLSDWLKAQLSKDRDLPRLLRFLDKELRNDAKNLTLAVWASRNAPRLLGTATGQAVAEEATARILAYLVERKYLRASDLPALYRALNDSERSSDMIKPIVTRMLTRKIGITSKAVHDLLAAAVDNPTAASMSIEHWNDPDPKIRKRAKSWRQPHAPPKDRDSAGKIEVDRRMYAVMIWQAIFTGRLHVLEWLSPPDHVTFRLRTGTQPLHTSGQWDRKTGLVTWSGLLESQYLPMLCHALWCRENAGFQTAHFGRVILVGQNLVEYCLWRKSLTPGEARKWDAFLASCKPGRKLPQRIKRFGFLPPDAEGSNKPSENDYAQTGVNILIRAMDPKR